MKSFTWITQKGEPLLVTQMDTSHIFNCVRMIFNYYAPAKLKLPGKVERPPGKSFWHNAIISLLTELAERKDVSPEMDNSLRYMLANAPEVFGPKRETSNGRMERLKPLRPSRRVKSSSVPLTKTKP